MKFRSNTREQTQANYDRLSRFYDLLTSGTEQKIQQEGMAGLRLQEGESVLEIGCGTGRALVQLARLAGNSGHVYGLDLSPGMLKVAFSRLHKEGLQDRVQLDRADAVNLPYPNCSMDAVFMSFTLELFSDHDISLVLQECGRVLKKGGRICLVAISRTRPGWALKLYEWIQHRFPVVIDCRPIYPSRELQEAGFSEINTVGRSVWGLPVEVVLAIK